jgi:hypothetical protein
MESELLLDHSERMLDLGADVCFGRFDLPHCHTTGFDPV